MIAACPRCSARYRVDRDRLGPEGARLRCAKCQAVFRVRPPADEPPLVEAEPVPVERPAPRPAAPAAASELPAPSTSAARAPAGAPAESVAPGEEDRERLVVIADPEVESGKRTASTVAAWGLVPLLVHDGVEAMLTIQRTLPRAVVLDAALPKMYGFQICEVLKRNPSLRDIRVTLVGAIHHQGRYRRPPTDLYGADHYVERPDLPDALLTVLKGWGLPVRETDAPAGRAARRAPAPAAPRREPRPAPVTEPVPAEPARAEPPARAPAAPRKAAADGLDDERAKAERLARIVVSDIVLYNPEKFQDGVRGGDVVQALQAELAEGRALFEQRIDPRVRDERDYLVDELVRVARERGMR